MTHRPVAPPFFNYAESIVRYALTTTDRIDTELVEQNDHYHFRLTIHEDKQVEFFGEPYYYDAPDSDPICVYELWIGKSDSLPYKVRCELSHGIAEETIADPTFNTLSIYDFELSSHFDLDLVVRRNAHQNLLKRREEIVGQRAPEWTLTDMNGQRLSLSDLKSRVVLIQFTGVGCIPCKGTIPFMNGLQERYGRDELAVIAVDAWMHDLQKLRAYLRQNDITYPLLCGTDDLLEAYGTDRRVYVYYLLDEQRVIRVIDWRGGDGREAAITSMIEELL